MNTLSSLVLLNTCAKTHVRRLYRLHGRRLVAISKIRVFSVISSGAITNVQRIPIRPGLATLISQLTGTSASNCLIPASDGGGCKVQSSTLDGTFNELGAAVNFSHAHIFRDIETAIVASLIETSITSELVGRLINRRANAIAFSICSSKSSPGRGLGTVSGLPAVAAIWVSTPLTA